MTWFLGLCLVNAGAMLGLYCGILLTRYFFRVKPWHGVKPIPVLIYCKNCKRQHIDKGEWATRPHRTHKCEYCGTEWRTCLLRTVGVERLEWDDLEGTGP